MDELLLELEKAGLEVLDVKTQKEKERLSQRIIDIKSNIRDLYDEQQPMLEIVRRLKLKFGRCNRPTKSKEPK